MPKVQSTTQKVLQQKASNRGIRLEILGAILAGGQARRFGSDKAHALHQGRRLIDQVADALGSQSTALIVCGREEPGYGCIPDKPEKNIGPLGGLNAALQFAEEHGFTHVLSAGVDAPNVPSDLASQLSGDGASIVSDQPVIGLWPVAIAADLAEFIDEGGRALYGFADRVGARQVTIDPPLLNINRPDDLDG